MDLEQAKEIAEELTEMSTTGEDFLAGEMEDGKIVIERYSDENCEEQMTPTEAIRYARKFAINGVIKCCDALLFLDKHGLLNGHTLTEQETEARLLAALNIFNKIRTAGCDDGSESKLVKRLQY